MDSVLGGIVIAESAKSYKMVFVANAQLKMGAGKMAAQVGHAAVGLYQSAQAWPKVGGFPSFLVYLFQ